MMIYNANYNSEDNAQERTEVQIIILALIRDNPYVTRKEIAKLSQLADRTVSTNITKIKEVGSIPRIG